jgi:hypothetical protein
VESKLLTPGELVLKLRCKNERYVYRLTSERRIPFIKLGSGRRGTILFDERKVESWLKERSVDPVSPIRKLRKSKI